MSKSDSYLPSRNVQWFDEDARRMPSQPKAIACRVCNKIFTSNLALVRHYEETHTKGGNPSREHCGSSEENQLLGPFKPIPASHMPMGEIQPSMSNPLQGQPIGSRPFPISSPTPTNYLPKKNNSTPLPIPTLQSQAMPLQNVNLASGARAAIRYNPSPPKILHLNARDLILRPQKVPPKRLQKHGEVSNPSCDSTQPYFKQLDKPIPEVIEVYDSDNDDSNTGSGPNNLDLTLRL